MDVKIKKLDPNVVIPKYAKPGDAAMDLTATSIDYLEGNKIKYGTGLAFEIPEGHVGLLFPRSSICKKDLTLCNSVGVIDSGYRGEVSFIFKAHYLLGDDYSIGDRVGQIMIIPYPQINFIEVEELSETERGSGGFGSTNV